MVAAGAVYATINQGPNYENIPPVPDYDSQHSDEEKEPVEADPPDLPPVGLAVGLAALDVDENGEIVVQDYGSAYGKGEINFEELIEVKFFIVTFFIHSCLV